MGGYKWGFGSATAKLLQGNLEATVCEVLGELCQPTALCHLSTADVTPVPAPGFNEAFQQKQPRPCAGVKRGERI